jgi:predicted XRE-type DNA-binding protein
MIRQNNVQALHVIRGSGNIFRDFKDPNPDLEQLRAILAARILKVLDAKKLSVRKAHEKTGVAAADFSRIRRANFGRFTIDRLMSILDRLDQKVNVAVTVRPRARPKSHGNHPPSASP